MVGCDRSPYSKAEDPSSLARKDITVVERGLQVFSQPTAP